MALANQCLEVEWSEFRWKKSVAEFTLEKELVHTCGH